MGALTALFIALTVFGAGVTLIDLTGILSHASGEGHDDHYNHDDRIDHDHAVAEDHHGGSPLGLADRRVRRVAKALSVIRTGVYFSLGAGPMGWIALARGEGALKGILWSLISGILIAVLARVLRRLVRRDLDSTLKTKDFLMSTATVLVPIEPGAMGKVRVRQYGVETDLFARLRSGSAQKGELVTIVDYDDESCIVERQEPISLTER